VNKAGSDIHNLKFSIGEVNPNFTDYIPESEEIFNLSKEGRSITELGQTSEFAKKMNGILEGVKTKWR